MPLTIHVCQSTPISLLLFTFSLFNAYNLALRTRTYKFHHKIDPLASPHAKFVIAKLDLEPVAQPSFSQRLRSNLWFAFSYSWRWLLGMQPPSRGIPQMKEKTTRVQELYVWDPTELELELFSIYSPAHALIWLGMGSSYWMLSLLVMILLSFQVIAVQLFIYCKRSHLLSTKMNGLIQSYNILLKDRQLVAAEAMREYNDVVRPFICISSGLELVPHHHLSVCLPSCKPHSPGCCGDDSPVGSCQHLGTYIELFDIFIVIAHSKLHFYHITTS